MKLICAGSYHFIIIQLSYQVLASSLLPLHNYDSSDMNIYSQLESESEMMPGGDEPANPPIPCSSAGHMNTPVVNIINKSQET